VYAANINGQRLMFRVAGVYRRNLILRDQQTGTLWQHATGKALMGPLKGARLQPLGGELTRWLKWKAMYPHTTLAVEASPEHARFPGLIPRDRLIRLLERFTTRHAASGLITDDRLPMHEEIIGISLDGGEKAYPLAVLREQGMIVDRIGRDRIAILYDAKADHVVAFLCPENENIVLTPDNNSALAPPDETRRWTWTGKPLTAGTSPLQPLPVERQWWLGWVEFHPTTDIWSTPATIGAMDTDPT
jgi:hypothetical protein